MAESSEPIKPILQDKASFLAAKAATLGVAVEVLPAFADEYREIDPYVLVVGNTKPLGETLMGDIASSLLKEAKEEKEEQKVTEGKVSIREGWITIDEETAARLDKNPQLWAEFRATLQTKESIVPPDDPGFFIEFRDPATLDAVCGLAGSKVPQGANPAASTLKLKNWLAKEANHICPGHKTIPSSSPWTECATLSQRTA